MAVENVWVDEGDDDDPTFDVALSATAGNTLLFFLNTQGSATVPTINNLDARATTVQTSGTGNGSGNGGWTVDTLVDITSAEATATPSFDFPGTLDWQCVIVEISDHPTSGGAIQVSTESEWGTGTSGTINVDNIDPTNDDSLAVSLIAVIDMNATGDWSNNGGSDPTDDNGYTDRGPYDNVTNVQWHSMLFDKVVSTEADTDAALSWGAVNKRQIHTTVIFEQDTAASQTLNGVLFSNAPAFPAGQANLRINGALFANPPIFPAGAVQPQPVTLDGALFSNPPVFPAGSVNQRLNGALFSKPPSFPAGQIDLRVNGVLFANPPVFPTGNVIGSQSLTGALFSNPPVFPTGQVNLRLLGSTFANGPAFPAGSANLVVVGSTFANGPAFPTGQVNQRINGVLFVNGPAFPTGNVALDAQTVSGVLFANPPAFPTGAVQPQPVTIAGVLFSKPPSFPVGAVVAVSLDSISIQSLEPDAAIQSLEPGAAVASAGSPTTVTSRRN